MYRRLLLLLFLVGLSGLSLPVHAIDFVGANTNAGDTDTLTVAKPPDVETGDLMIAQMSFRGGEIAYNAPAGWTEVAPRTNSGDEVNQVVFYRFATSPDPENYTFTIGSAQHFALTISAYRGVDPTDPFDAMAVQSGTATNPVAPSIDTGAQAERIVGLWSRAHQQTLTPPAPMVARGAPTDGAGAGGIRGLLADEPFAGPGATGTRTATSGGGGSRHYIGRLLALRGAPGDVPAQLRFAQQPTDTTRGQFISPSVTVRIEDADGNLVTAATEPVTVELWDGPAATLSGTTTVNAVDGVATFDNLSVDTIGTGYTLRATSGTLDPDTSDPFDILEPQQEANAFDPDTPAGTTVGGNIRTKIAGALFDLDIVMIDDGEVDEGFNRPVDVWLLDARDNSGTLDSVGCRDSWEVIDFAGSIDFGDVAGGRATLEDIQEDEAWRQVRVMIEQTFPPGQAGVRGCSTDAFAIRPDRFIAVEARNANGELLDQTDPQSGPVQVAGDTLSITAEAVNAQGQVTTRYEGSPDITLVMDGCAGPGCVEGSLTAETWDADGGVLESADARYDEVGAFTLIIEDRDFASVDSDDTSEEQRTIASDPVEVGRFIPDHFTLDYDPDEPIVHRAALQCDPESEFTYFGERFDVNFGLVARNTAGEITQNYDDDVGYARLPADAANYGMAAYDEAETLIEDLEVTGIETEWEDGATDVTVQLALSRDCEDEDIDCPRDPFAELYIGTAPVDLDGVALTSFDLPVNDDEEHAEVAIADIRFGRLVMDNVAGSELVDLQLPLFAQYWDDDTWRLNADDECTVIDVTEEVELESSGGTTVAFGESKEGEALELDSGSTALEETDEITLGQDGFPGGRAAFTLTAPGSGNTGWVDIRTDLEDRYPHLLDDRDDDGEWDDSPEARAIFGIFAGPDNRIQIREVSP